MSLRMSAGADLAFGAGEGDIDEMEFPPLPDESDEELVAGGSQENMDAFNEETFNAGDVLADDADYEMQKMVEQTARAKLTDDISPPPPPGEDRSELWEQAMLEANVQHLLADDSIDAADHERRHALKLLSNASASGGQPTAAASSSLFLTGSTNIWSYPLPSSTTLPTTTTQPVALSTTSSSSITAAPMSIPQLQQNQMSHANVTMPPELQAELISLVQQIQFHQKEQQIASANGNNNNAEAHAVRAAQLYHRLQQRYVQQQQTTYQQQQQMQSTAREDASSTVLPGARFVAEIEASMYAGAESKPSNSGAPPPRTASAYPSVAIASQQPLTVEELERRLRSEMHRQQQPQQQQHKPATQQSQHNELLASLMERRSPVPLPPPGLERVVPSSSAGRSSRSPPAAQPGGGHLPAAPPPPGLLYPTATNSPLSPHPIFEAAKNNPQLRAAVIAHIRAGSPLPPGCPPPHVLLRSPLFAMPRFVCPPGGSANSSPMPTAGGFRLPPPPMASGSGSRNRPPAAILHQQQPPMPHAPVQRRLFDQNQTAALSNNGHQHSRTFYVYNRNTQQQRVFSASGRGAQTQQQRYYSKGDEDPYANLVGRREKEWLCKIYGLSLPNTGNPYSDDFYWTMYRNKAFARERHRAGHYETIELFAEQIDDENVPASYQYKPPKFAGALGKPTLVTSNCPRQLIDLASADDDDTDDVDTNGDTPPPHSQRRRNSSISSLNAATPGSSDVSSAPLHVAHSQHSTVANRRFKSLMLDIENLWTVMLDCDDKLRIVMNADEEQRQQLVHEIAAQMEWFTARSAASSHRLAQLLAVHKGRTLIGRAVRHLTRQQLGILFASIATQLTTIAKRDTTNELSELVLPGLLDSAKRLTADQLLAVTAPFSFDLVGQSLATKSRFAFDFVLLVLLHCARMDVLSPSAAFASQQRHIVQALSQCVRSDLSGSLADGHADWLAKDHVTKLCDWLIYTCKLDRSSCEAFGQLLAEKLNLP